MQRCLYVINCQISQTTGQRIQYWLTAASGYDLFYSYCVTHSWMGCSHEAVKHSLSVLWKLLHVSSDTSQSVRLMSWNCMRIPWNPFSTVIGMGLAWPSCREAVLNRRVGSLILVPCGVLKLLLDNMLNPLLPLHLSVYERYCAKVYKIQNRKPCLNMWMDEWETLLKVCCRARRKYSKISRVSLFILL